MILDPFGAPTVHYRPLRTLLATRRAGYHNRVPFLSGPDTFGPPGGVTVFPTAIRWKKGGGRTAREEGEGEEVEEVVVVAAKEGEGNKLSFESRKDIDRFVPCRGNRLPIRLLPFRASISDPAASLPRRSSLVRPAVYSFRLIKGPASRFSNYRDFNILPCAENSTEMYLARRFCPLVEITGVD